MGFFRARGSIIVALALGGSLIAHAGVATAQQVSDADRKAARDLYGQADALQKAGKFAEALDAFQRSYAVFQAPTTALHVAQCQAAVGHLLEAEESYRALSNAKLPENSSPAFVQAQEQARIELAQVSPRVPALKITTTPAPSQLPGLVVTVDGQPMNVALVGASRPVNPGMHKVVARANGFAPVEASVSVQEKETREVPLSLKRGHGGGVVVPSTEPTLPTTAGTATATGQVTYAPAGTSSTPTMYGASGYAPPQTGSSYATGWNPPYAQRTKRASTGLFVTGIILIPVGVITTLTGVVVIASESRADVATNTGTSVTLLGLAALGGGIAMTVIGGKRVPVTDATWMPHVNVSPRGATATWTF